MVADNLAEARQFMNSTKEFIQETRSQQEENLARFATTDQKLNKIDQKLDSKIEWLAAMLRSAFLLDKTPSPMPDIPATHASGSGNRPDGVLGAGRPSDRIPGTGRAAQFGVHQSHPLQEISNRSSLSLGNGMSRNPKIDFPSCEGSEPRSWVRIVEEFNKLIQEDDIESYNEKFEELRTCMLAYNPALPESYFLSSYISGLKQEIKNLVKLSRPKSLAAAYEEARMHYDAIQAIIADLEQEYSDQSDSMENIEDWDADTDRDADVGCQGLSVLGVNFNQEAKRQHHSMDGVLEVHPKESNGEARDQSVVINTEFKGKTTSLNFELLVYEDCSRVAKCQKCFRNYEIAGAHKVYDEMPMRSFKGSDSSVLPINAPLFMGNWVFNPRGFINFRLVEKAGFGLREVPVASDKKKDSKQICQTVNWEIEDNMDSWVMQGSVMQIPVVGNGLNWIGCIGIFNCIRAVGESHSMPFDRGKSQIFQSCPLCNKFIGEMQSSLVFVGAWIGEFGLPEMDCKLLVVVECVWMKQVTSSYERNYVQQIAQGSDAFGMFVDSTWAIVVVKPIWKSKVIASSSFVLEANFYELGIGVVMVKQGISVAIVDHALSLFPFDPGGNELTISQYYRC